MESLHEFEGVFSTSEGHMTVSFSRPGMFLTYWASHGLVASQTGDMRSGVLQ